MSTIFTKIIEGEIPSYKIAEDSNFLAFLDVFPLVEGHTLVVPKFEIDYIFDLDNDILTRLHIFSKEVAVKIKKAIPCERIGISVIGLEVPHAHIHLLPINKVEDMNFSKPKLQLMPERFQEIAIAIRNA